MGPIYQAIARRLDGFSINLDDFVYPGTAKEKKGAKTLDGISFVAQTKVIGGEPVIGIEGLRNAFAQARNGGYRAFAGQILKEDLDHVPLQASFLATDGLGFREIFYLSQLPAPTRDPGAGNVLDSDGRAFDAKFGKMTDAQNVTSLHADLVGPTRVPDAAAAGTGNLEFRSSIHLDDKGFVYADSDGRIFISSEVFQHTGDELGIKDVLLSSTSPLSFFVHTDLNSISDPTLGSVDLRNNNFLRKRVPRGVLGLELSKESNGVQLFVRGSMGVEASNAKRPKSWDFSGVAGVRAKF